MNFVQTIKKPMVYIGAMCLLLVVIVTLQSILLPPKTYIDGGIEYTHYNNYVIFKYSFFHLIENKDLYQLYPQEYWDLYKYSPTFSLFMGLLAWMPDFFGLLLWNMLNVFVLFYALWKLPFESKKKMILAFLFLILPLLTTIQNSQSNGLIAGLMIFSYIHLEKKKTALAALCIVATMFIKLFGIIALVLFLCYPGKFKAFLYTVGWIAFFAVLPLLIISGAQMEFLYKSWFFLLQNDGTDPGGWVSIWFGAKARPIVLFAGCILLCLPLIHYKHFHERKIRLSILSSVLIWVVIFNHKAESPTYIIAVCGIAIWYFTQRFRTENLILILLVCILTILPATEFFPQNWVENLVFPYDLKAIPCILVWLKITWDLIFYKPEDHFPGQRIAGTISKQLNNLVQRGSVKEK